MVAPKTMKCTICPKEHMILQKLPQSTFAIACRECEEEAVDIFLATRGDDQWYGFDTDEYSVFHKQGDWFTCNW